MSKKGNLKRQEEEFMLKVIDSNYLMLSTCLSAFNIREVIRKSTSNEQAIQGVENWLASIKHRMIPNDI